MATSLDLDSTAIVQNEEIPVVWVSGIVKSVENKEFTVGHVPFENTQVQLWMDEKFQWYYGPIGTFNFWHNDHAQNLNVGDSVRIAINESNKAVLWER
jgi:quercetin dioxygenase-like cupin family protein